MRSLNSFQKYHLGSNCLIDDRIRIIHLIRGDGTGRFFHTFDAGFLAGEQNTTGIYGGLPDIGDVNALKSVLYSLADRSVRKWVSDHFFTKNFLLSTLGFFVCYLFMTFVIRDPIPVLDELLFSSVTGTVLYRYLLFRDGKSKAAMELRVMNKQQIDHIHLYPVKELEEVEEWIAAVEASKNPEEIAKLINSSPFSPGVLKTPVRAVLAEWYKGAKGILNRLKRNIHISAAQPVALSRIFSLLKREPENGVFLLLLAMLDHQAQTLVPEKDTGESAETE